MPAPTVPRGPRTSLWAKLWALTLLANMAGVLAAIWVSRLVRGGTVSEGGEQWLVIGYWTAVCVVACVDALLLDELFFAGAFRKTHLQGRGARPIRKDEDIDDAAASVQRTNVAMPVLLVISGVFTYFLLDSVNGGFSTYYRYVGEPIRDLRYGDEAEQVAAVQVLATRREREVLPALLDELQAEDEGESAVWTAWALGHWRDLVTRRPLVEPLVSASRRGDPALRREALVALGRLQHRASADAIQAEIRSAMAAGETVDPRLLYALGSIQVMSSTTLLEELLHKGDPDIQRMAAWALAQHRDQREGRSVVEVLERRLPSASLPLRCAIVHALGILTDERSNAALMQAYDAATEAERQTVCVRIELSMRPDGSLDDREELLTPDDVFAVKIFKSMGQMRATDPALRGKVEPWLEQIVRAGATEEIRESARALLGGIRAGRDDSKGISAEEALGAARGR